MKARFVCPSCGAAGLVDTTLVGKHVRCKHCRERFAIPGPGKAENEGYDLDELPPEAVGVTSTRPEPDSAFVPSRGKDQTAATPPRIKRAESGSTARTARRPGSGIARRAWLIRGMIVAVLVSAAIALFAPRGTLIVGSLLMTLGSVMVLLGFSVGAYGAFREDLLYGILYLLIPLYTAYYLITRWDDLWAWVACSTAGVALVVLGTEMLRWNGVGS